MHSDERALRDAATAMRRLVRRVLAAVSAGVDLLAAGQVDEAGIGSLDPE
jgi:hypothetical protein